MGKYLYGAAVQGIQGFIFQTNRLKEIVGASELVEGICTGLFASTLYGAASDNDSGQNPPKAAWDRLLSDPNRVMNAAGNIKYIFDDEKACRNMVRVFPKTVMEFAPGITISQSVVSLDNKTFAKAIDELERNLRAQRNRPMRDLSIGLMGVLRSRETGLPVTHVRGKAMMDSATYHKLINEDSDKRKETTLTLSNKAFGFQPAKSRLPMDVKDMTSRNDWIAIIHADGNGLGTIVQKIGRQLDDFREFSRLLDKATIEAARLAFDDVITARIGGADVIPMRPIVLSGDDHTVICRADLAVPYTVAFIRRFEEQTKCELGEILRKGTAAGPVFADRSGFLTACAGIVFMKSSFPFHFGYRLAESLCDRAKKDTKALFKAADGNLPASCLMFHKIQDSFITDFADIARRELSPQKDISFAFGPYYLKKEAVTGKNRWTIDQLTARAEMLQGQTGNAVKSGLRRWMTQLHDEPEMAAQSLSRMKDTITDGVYMKFIDEVTTGHRDGTNCYPVYDILALHTITNQTTK